MLRTLLNDENNQFQVIEQPEEISEIVKDRKRQLWIDVEKPTQAELALIQDEFQLHPLAIDDASRQHQRPKVDQYENFYFVVFYGISITSRDNKEPIEGRTGLKGTRFHNIEIELPNTQSPGAPPAEQVVGKALGEQLVLREISMFLGANYLITVHNQPAPEFEEVARRWLRNAEDIKAEMKSHGHIPGARPLTEEEEQGYRAQTNGNTGGTHPATTSDTVQTVNTDLVMGGPRRGEDLVAQPQPDQVDETGGKQPQHVSDIGILLYSMLDTMVDSYFPVVDSIVDRVEDLEEQIFERFNERALESVFSLKKDLLALRKVLAPERDVLNVLTRRDIPIFEEHTIVYLQDVYDHVVRITDSIDTYRDLLSSALDSFLSMQSNRLNITVQTLTSFSIILMSISIFTGWYGMNFQNMPELHTTFGYPVLAGVIAVVVGLEVLYFKRRGWL